jgi:choline dehydrogenase-like flavoprotein
LYGGPKQYDQFPIGKKSEFCYHKIRADGDTDKKHAFAMITELFSPRSKGSVTLTSADPLENPVVDCNYLADPLDVLVMSEGCRLGNEIAMNLNKVAGEVIVKGSWPAGAYIHYFGDSVSDLSRINASCLHQT